MLPQVVSDFLRAGESCLLPGACDVVCEGARFHSPTPMFVHDVALVPPEWLYSLEAQPEQTPMRAWLCGTCRDNIKILQQMLHQGEGSLPWEVRRSFGNDIRRLAESGWRASHPRVDSA